MDMDMKISALIGAAGMLAFPAEPQFYVLCAVAVSTVGSIALQIIKGRQERQRRQADEERYERDRQNQLQHQREMQQQYQRTAQLTIEKAAEVKREVNVAQALTATAARELRTELGVNTDLTREAIQQADRAREVAAQVEEKMGKIVTPVTQDTNDVVHRIEDGKGE